MEEQLKHKKRSNLRIKAGILFYTLKRRLQWIFDDKRYAKSHTQKDLAYTCFTHQTPLYRKLKDVDMWMQYNKVDNLKIALKNLDGLIIKPNETFSYWKTIGNPKKRKGYKPGMVIHNGQFSTGIGGGLCQLSNLIYWMAIHLPLNVTERYRHSFDVFPDVNRKQPFGSGATCLYNYRDLQLHNDTIATYQFKISIQGDYLVGEVRSNVKPSLSYDVYEKSHRITQATWGAYIRHNEIYRRVYDLHGSQIDDEFVCENHALMMYNPLIESLGLVKESYDKHK